MAGQVASATQVRAVPRFYTRVLAQFRSPQNLAYLQGLFSRRVPAGALRKHALATLHDALLSFSEGEGRAYDLLLSDSVARRGAARPAAGLWSEVRRLNLAFFTDRLAALNALAPLVDPQVPRDGISEDDEPYHMRMFISDTLRPPGLEHLNAPGPLWGIREDAADWDVRPPFPRPAADDPGELLFADAGEDDAPWGHGDANRTPEAAVAEYWGDSHVSSETMTGSNDTGGRAYGSRYAWGDQWSDNLGTRFQRYPEIQFWKKGGREGVDYEIEETLGTAGRELDNPVRRWDLSKLRDPRGQDTRRYGPRSSYAS